MKAYIKKIALFNKHGEQRQVDLRDGLNVITGYSKTGKSALIEIVDYCLFSSRSTIPKGVITNFASLFAIVLKVEEKFLVIARPAAISDNWKKAYFKIETDDDFLKDFSCRYFETLELKTKADVQSEVEKFLGLSITNTTIDIDKNHSDGKATMRSFVSLLFQHQNLISNKHAMFYRFDDYHKRKRTINEVPAFMGWVTGEYYSLKRELEEKERSMKAEKQIQKQIELNNQGLESRLFNIIENYYVVLGLELDKDLSLNELKKIGQNLPKLPETAYSASELPAKLSELKMQRRELREELLNIDQKQNDLKRSNDYASDYVFKIKEIEETVDLRDGDDAIQCPVCSNRVLSVEKTLDAVIQSKIKLVDELNKTGTYREDNYGQVSHLESKRNEIKRELRKLTAKITHLEELEEIKDDKPLRDQAMQLKGVIETTVKQILGENKLARESVDLNELKEQIAILKDRISAFDVETKYERANTFLIKRMNEICSRLDFEEELKPVGLHFDLRDFSFFHLKDKAKIYLSEMGSGANWLACHLSLFIALLHLVCNEDKASVPSILFIDQPSQVYFPNEFSLENTKDENLKQVENVFNVIIAELNEMNKKYNYYPQVVVLEHADKLELDGVEFNSFVRKRWDSNGEKLI